MNSVIHSYQQNGLTILTDFVKHFESVTLSILVKNGSRNEEKIESGISHFIEHMVFKGTNIRKASDIAREFDCIGGNFNAYTSKTVTVYYAKVLKNDLEKAVDIFADMLINSSFSEEELEKERNVILQELYMAKDTPDDIVFDYFQETAFKNQPLGRSILGSEEFIKNVTSEKLYKYFKDHYSAGNMVISLSGNFSESKFISLVKSKFQHLQSSYAIPYKKANYVGGETHVKKKLEQTQFLMGFQGVSCLDEKFYSLQILSIIIGGGMSSKLFQEVREKKGLVYHISSFMNSYNDCGVFGIYSALSPVNIKILIDLIIDIIRKMISGITEKDVKRAKTQMISNLLMSLESTHSRSKMLCENFATFNRYISSEKIFQEINNTDVRSVEEAARYIFSNKNITITTLGNNTNIYDYDKIINKLFL